MAAIIALVAPEAATAQPPFTILHSFAGGTDGAVPFAPLIQATDGNFYGTTSKGGGTGCSASLGCGAVFKLTPDGTVTLLHVFAATDGAHPGTSLIQGSNGNFYGTTSVLGGGGSGTIFTMTPTGAITVLHVFPSKGYDVNYDLTSLMQARDGNFYGTTSSDYVTTYSDGSHANGGTIFKMTSSGTFTVLHEFSLTDGNTPFASLIQGADGNFYGTTSFGGTTYGDGGTVFKMSTDGTLEGTVVTVLHSFDDPDGSGGKDGYGPHASLIQASDGNFYGTTAYGGATRSGTVFKVTPTGTFTALHAFGTGDGSNPEAALIQAIDGNFYGTTAGGWGCGTLFKMTSSGTVTVLHAFTCDADGGAPFASLIQATDGNLFGTASFGGDASLNYGVVFELVIAAGAPAITTQPANQFIASGATANLSVVASGTGLSYQWYVGPSGTTTNAIAGATSASYTTSPLTTTTSYWVRVSNSAGIVDSGTATVTATVTVVTAPAITMQPANQTVNAGGTASFTSAASGAPAPSVQWQVSTNNGSTYTAISGATAGTYSFVSAAIDNGKQFRAVFTNTVGTVTSTAATLTLNSAPAVTIPPTNQTVTAGGTATFTAAASGNPTPTVQWQVSTNSGSTFSAISGATVGTYSFVAGAADNGKQFRALFTNSVGTVTSTAATLTVTPVTMSLDQTALAFSATTNGASFTSQTSAQAVRLTQSGAGTVTWTATSNQPWLVVSPTSGTGSGTLNISVQFAAGLSGTPTGSITLTFTGAGNSPGPITASLNLIQNGTSAAPIGSFDSPVNGTTGIAGSIGVTGWALDDVQVTRVTICRDAVSGEAAPAHPLCNGLAKIYIGDAVFVDGARPDIQTAYPNAPSNTRAGWGYLMLTNFLPNQGNGTFTFYAYASDADGHTTLLGTKTITCANASSPAPFGAIDTPGQGDVISGTYNNFGWVLSPTPNHADPSDGGVVTVLIDGVNVGSPGGFVARSDLTTLFPAATYPGVSKAAAAFTFNTTAFTNGVHSIAWIVTGSPAGGTSGVGSRFFTVSNGSLFLDPSLTTGLQTTPSNVIAASGVLAVPPAAALRGAAASATTLASEVDAAPQDVASIPGLRGYDLAAALQSYRADGDGHVVVQSEELDRVELHLSSTARAEYTGYLRVPTGVAPLPIGSTLDPATNVFTWMPGAGFVGTYNLVFVRWGSSQAVARREVRIVLNPKGSNRVGRQTIIDMPGADQVIGQPFFLAGWATDLDAAWDSGVDTVHVWAYPVNEAGQHDGPIFIGAAIYGGARPDVAAVYGDRFLNSGYGLGVQGLAPGTYDLAVFAHSTVQEEFAAAKTVRITVR